MIERQKLSLNRYWMLESMGKLLHGCGSEKDKLGIQANKIERKRHVLGTRGTWTLAI
jgi:hypothetical protein